MSQTLEERVTLLEFRIEQMENTSKDNNDRLKRIEKIFWVGLGLLTANLATGLGLLEKFKFLP